MGTKELEKKSSGGGLVAAWKQNPLVSTSLVLILMIVVQTAIMIFNFGEGSVGELMLSLLTNWLNILRNNAPVGIIALGMTFVIISGGIDLSVGSTLVAVGAMVMMVVDGSATGLLAGMGITGVPAYIIAIAVGLVFGALLGWLNGVLIAHGKLPPFIVTLGTQLILYSCLLLYVKMGNNGGMAISGLDKSYSDFIKGSIISVPTGNGTSTPIPNYVWFAILLAAVMWFIWNKTTFGKNMFALGSNEEAARVSGVNVLMTTVLVFALAGAMYGWTGFVEGARVGSNTANTGLNYELDGIAACVIGGVSFVGGIGKIRGIVIGVLLLRLIFVGLNMASVNQDLIYLVKGGIILFACALDMRKYLVKK